MRSLQLFRIKEQRWEKSVHTRHQNANIKNTSEEKRGFICFAHKTKLFKDEIIQSGSSLPAEPFYTWNLGFENELLTIRWYWQWQWHYNNNNNNTNQHSAPTNLWLMSVCAVCVLLSLSLFQYLYVRCQSMRSRKSFVRLKITQCNTKQKKN